MYCYVLKTKEKQDPCVSADWASRAEQHSNLVVAKVNDIGDIFRQLRAGFSEDCNARPSQTRRSGELLKGGKPFYINLIKQIIYSRISYSFCDSLHYT